MSKALLNDEIDKLLKNKLWRLNYLKEKIIIANYPNVFSFRKCIIEFRELFKKKNLALLYIFFVVIK